MGLMTIERCDKFLKQKRKKVNHIRKKNIYFYKESYYNVSLLSKLIKKKPKYTNLSLNFLDKEFSLLTFD